MIEKKMGDFSSYNHTLSKIRVFYKNFLRGRDDIISFILV